MIPEKLLSDAEIRYHGLMAIWDRDTMALSGGYQRHPAFKAILDLGLPLRRLVQFALLDISEHPHEALLVLWGVAPEQPVVPEEMRGKIDLICDLWRRWGRDHDYAI